MAENRRPKVFLTKQVEPISEVPDPEAPSETFRDELPTMVTEFELPVLAEVYETVTLKVPQNVYEAYRKTAIAQDMTVEELMQHRLSVCRNHNALRGLWFSDSERSKLEDMLQKWPLESASQALSILARAGTISFDDIQVTLSPTQKRVLNLAMYGGRTPQSFFESMIKKELRTS